MGAPALLKIDVIADATKALQALGKVGDQGKTTGSKLGSLKSTMVGVFGTAAVVAFGKASVGAALESQKATANLEQGFKSMGETTGDAAKAAEAYASSLSKKIGVDDDAIIASQALLVTFGSVSNEAARSAGVFDRTTTAAADLAAKGFGSMDSNAVLLGKALNDPTAGIAKLGKAGVQFTEAQKKQIKTMQESGDTIGAQKVMLGELEKQVGGTAAATATSSEKSAVAFGEVQEAVGNALLPALEELSPVLQDVAGFLEDNMSWLLPLAAAIGGVVVATKAWGLATEVWSGIQKIATGIQAAFNAVMAANPVLLAVLAIAALVAIVVLAYQKVDWFRAAVDKAWQFIQKAWDAVLGAFQKVWNWIKQNWPLLLAILTGPIGAAVLLIVRNWDTIKRVVLGVFTSIKDGVTGVWRWVSDKFQAIADKVTGVMDGVRSAINGFIRGWNRLRVPQVKFDIPGGSFLPGVPDSVSVGGWDLPNLPLLARGGSVLKTGMAVVHAGEQFSGVGRSFGGSTVINLSVTTTGLGADAPQIQRAIVHALRGWTSRNGALDVPVRSA